MEKWRRVWRDRDRAAAVTSRFARSAIGSCSATIAGCCKASSPRRRRWMPTPIAPSSAAVPSVLCGWLGEGRTSVGAVEEYFTAICEAADAAFGEPAACRFFFNWFDDSPRRDAPRDVGGSDAALPERDADSPLNHFFGSSP